MCLSFAHTGLGTPDTTLASYIAVDLNFAQLNPSQINRPETSPTPAEQETTLEVYKAAIKYASACHSNDGLGLNHKEALNSATKQTGVSKF